MSRVCIPHWARLAAIAGACAYALLAVAGTACAASAQNSQSATQVAAEKTGDAKPIKRRKPPFWVTRRIRPPGIDTLDKGNTHPPRHCPRGWTGKPPVCCAPGQRYVHGRCVGKDTTRDCPPGKVMTRGHCCFPGQRWTGRACVGGGGDDRQFCPPGTKGKFPRCVPLGTLTPPDRLHAPPVVIDPPVVRVPPVVRIPQNGGPPASPGVTRLPRLTPPQVPPQVPSVVVSAKVPRFRPGELLVLVRGDNPDGVADNLARSFNLTVREGVTLRVLRGARVYRLGIPDNRSVEGLAAAVARIPGVSIASPNYYSVLQGDPREPPGETSREAPSSAPEPSPVAPSSAPRSGAVPPDAQYALPKLRIPGAQRLSHGRGVVVAIIDSAVDTAHPVLRDANIEVLDALTGSVPQPDKHGTAITGIIAAHGELTGIAPEAKIIAVRAFAPEIPDVPPVTTSMALATAVDLAVEKGARVFNMSFAGPRDPLLIAVIDAAHADGAIFVAAAGNNGPDAPPAFPAAHDKVIAVTATDANDRIYPYANRGEYLSVAAPGVDIIVPVTEGRFDYLSGTSFAAAHVSGIVALLVERNPGLLADDVRRILTETAHDLGEKGPDQSFGAGLADAYETLARGQGQAQGRK